MKDSKSIILILLILVLAGGLFWKLRSKAPSSTEAKPILATDARKIETASKVAAIEPPKTAPTKPADLPTPVESSANSADGLTPAQGPSLADRLASRAARRQAVEKLMQTQLDRIQERLNNATTDLERQGYQAQLAGTRQNFQWQIDRLAQPPPAPMDLGEVLFTDGTPMDRPLADGGTVSLGLGTTPDGHWQLGVSIQHPNPDGGSSRANTAVSATPGQPLTIDFNDYQIHLVPQVPAGAVPGANWAPPPAAAPPSNGTPASKLSQ